jgi:hypothetical protein
MALENEKAMGPIRPPMASHPFMGLGLWVTLVKIKIKKEEVENSNHCLSFEKDINPIHSELSRGI